MEVRFEPSDEQCTACITLGAAVECTGSHNIVIGDHSICHGHNNLVVGAHHDVSGDDVVLISATPRVIRANNVRIVDTEANVLYRIVDRTLACFNPATRRLLESFEEPIIRKHF